jgi:hypothetical protein
MKYTEKHWAVLFWHNPLGWTISTVCQSQVGAEQELKRQREMLPNFDYRIVPCTVSFETIKAHG